MRQMNQVDPGIPEPIKGGEPEGAAFNAVAPSSRRIPAAIAVAGIAVLAFALITKQSAPAASAPTAGVIQRPSPAQAVSSPGGAAVVSIAPPTSGAPSRNPTVTPNPTFAAVPAEAGATQLVPAGPTPVRLTIALPDGWEKAGDAMYVKANRAAPARLSLSAWHLQHVYTFPCRWASQAFADGSLMGTAKGQADALSSWWGQDPNMLPYWNAKIAPLATKPKPTTIQGYPAWQLEVLIPSTLDLVECDGGQLVLWDAANGDVRYSLGPRETHRLWVVDVNGELIVIDATSSISASSADVAELQAVVDSIAIEP